jgi:hypothetical protein
MSNSPDPAAKINVTADAGYPNAEITLFDSGYRIQQRSVGKLNLALAPGFYKIRYRAGNSVHENLFEVEPGAGDLNIPPPKWRLETAAPITDSDSSSEVEQLARKLSLDPPVTTGGTGCQVFIFIRKCKQAERGIAHSAPMRELSLHDASGKLLMDLSSQPMDDGCSGCNAELAPGCYLLRLKRPQGPSIEQTIVACEGWQTQVFLRMALLRTSDTAPSPDLFNAAILMSLESAGFDPASDQFAWTESARQQLAVGYPIVPEQRLRDAVRDGNNVPQDLPGNDLRKTLQAKFINPMLGIFSAHRMMMLQNPDEALVREVSANLKRLVGHHPDVAAIDLWLDPHAQVPPFPLPPMLRSSWAILVNRSRSREDLIPPGSYALRASSRLWGAGAWLVWQEPEPAVAAPAPNAAQTASSGFFDRAFSWYWNLGRQDINGIFEWARVQLEKSSANDFECNTQIADLVAKSQAMALTGVEHDIFAYIVNAAVQHTFVTKVADQISGGGIASLFRKVVPSDLAKSATTLVDDLTKDHIASKLGIPLAAVVEGINGVESKFSLMMLAEAYDKLRSTMDAGDERTLYMEQMTTEMKSLAGLADTQLDRLKNSASAGERLAAVSFLEVKPHAEMIPWLADRLIGEKPFIGYHAALALDAAAAALPAEKTALQQAIEKGMTSLAGKEKTDRYRTLSATRARLQAAP